MNDKIKSILWIAFAVVFAVVFIIWMAASPRPDHIKDTNGAEDYSLQQITPADVAAQEMGSRGAPSTREIRFNIAGIGITSGTEYYSRKFTGVYRLYTCTIFKGSDVYVQLANFEINGGNFAFYVLLDGEIIGDGENLDVCRFDGNTVETGVPSVYRIPNRSRHGGGDFNLVSEMIRILRRNDPDEIRETTEEALQSHLICFAAERSRLAGGKVIEIN